ncbi:MAG TPA: glycosyltransferase family 2 protein [Patescibacteria group bacterium]|nr:glycosyltransferase family 2 protein [Patescibacteria group bacterium]
MKKITIVTVHYKSKDLTLQCLQSINKLKSKGFELETIVVNNNPQEKINDLKKKFPKFIFLETKENLGFAGGYNLGMKKAFDDKADYIFIINNDTILDENLLVHLFKVAEKRKKAGLLSPKIYFAPGHEFHRDRYQESERGKVLWFVGGIVDWQNVLTQHRGVDEVDQGQYDQIEETDYISGCAMLIKRKVIEKIGFLDKKYFAYYEDSDYSVRAKKAGFQLLFVPQAKMWHFNASSSEVGGSLHDYYLTRNRLLFGLRYAPLRAKLALFKWGLSRLLIGRPWQKIGFRDFLINRFGKGSYEA